MRTALPEVFAGNGRSGSLSRRHVLAGLGTLAVSSFAQRTGAANGDPLRLALTPVLMISDLDLLERLRTYLTVATGMQVELLTRRTYQEITSLVVSGQVDAAWICGYPFVKYRERLSLVAVPLWQQQPLYQSYLIVDAGRAIDDWRGLRGDIHAFSDPDSNSGYLVTAALLAEERLRTETFFEKSFFTYGHRNIVRAVASGLAQSGSVDGYVWEVMAKVEPELTGRTRIIRRSESLGFPPIACSRDLAGSEPIRRLREALLGMAETTEGRDLLSLLQFDGFAEAEPDLFAGIAEKVRLLEQFG